MSPSHERFDRDKLVRVGSNRTFGWVFTAFFTIVALAPLRHGDGIRFWAIMLAVLFLLTAMFYPSLLGPANKAWFRFGLLLNKIVSPIIMGFIFFVVFTPMAIVMRSAKRDALRLRHDAEADSYWIPRDPPGPSPKTMKYQF